MVVVEASDLPARRDVVAIATPLPAGCPLRVDGTDIVSAPPCAVQLKNEQLTLQADVAASEIQSLNRELSQRVQELERVGRALRTLSAGNSAMLRARTEQALLDSMCTAIVGAGAYSMVVVWYRGNDGSRTLKPMAVSGYPGGLRRLEALQATWADDERGRGASARAVRTGERQLVRDMRTDPAYLAWQQALGGQVSALSFPLRVHEEVIGALTLHSLEADAFGEQEIQLLAESADDLAFGIGALRTREEQFGMQRAMHHLTYHDPLTGLPNEALFDENLRALMAVSTATQAPFALIQINVQRLRDVNDALGFDQGDHVLREFGARLRTVVNEPDSLSRLRGEEFAVLLPGADNERAMAVAAAMHQALLPPCVAAGIPLELHAAIGVVLFPQHGVTARDLLRHVDIAARLSKERAEPHVLFEATSENAQPNRLQLAAELKQAIHGDQLRVFLQPKVDMASGQVCGAEALVRWEHPQRGQVLPGDFITLAEQTGLIKPLTEWMLRAVLGRIQMGPDGETPLPIAVNLSARNLRDEDLPRLLRRLLAETDVPPGTLELEITESVAMDDPDFTLRVLGELRELGIPLYIDDFGTGYSSLGYLARLPVSSIKIDQSFVRRMGTDKDCATIVKSTIDLAHDLGRTVVAEGVETEEDWLTLRELGCDVAQGYFIARPMPAEAFPAWLAQRSWCTISRLCPSGPITKAA